MTINTCNSKYFELIIEQKNGEEFALQVYAKCRVQNLKWMIYKQIKMKPKHQRLFFQGIELEYSDFPLCAYGIDDSTNSNGEQVEYRIIVLEKHISQTYFLDETHYDASWNRSYERTHKIIPQGLEEPKMDFRGGKRYFKPVGCVRYGVKVVGKYENDEWLGGKGLRPETEWPVAYHGTKELNVLEILRKGFLLEKGVRFAYGKGIFCSPLPYSALQYAHNYDFNGKQYKLIIQCRVDPKKLQIIANGMHHTEEYWLVPDEEAIRPYAICVYSTDGLVEATDQMRKFMPIWQRMAINIPCSLSLSAKIRSQKSQIAWGMSEKKFAQHFANYCSADVEVLSTAISALNVLVSASSSSTRISFLNSLEQDIRKFEDKSVPGLECVDGWLPLRIVLVDCCTSGNSEKEERALDAMATLLAKCSSNSAILPQIGELTRAAQKVLSEANSSKTRHGHGPLRMGALRALDTIFSKFPDSLPSVIIELIPLLQPALLAVLPDKEDKEARELANKIMSALITSHPDPNALFNSLQDMSADCEMLLKDDFLLDDLIEKTMGRQNVVNGYV